MRQKTRAILRIALAAIFISYYAGATLFPHTHTYEWGKVTHSHPYLPSGGHAHSTVGLQLLDQLSSFLFIITGTGVFLLFLVMLVVHAAPVCGLTKRIFTPCFSPRAPPFLRE